MGGNLFTGPSYCPSGKYLPLGGSPIISANCSSSGGYFPLIGCQCVSECKLNEYLDASNTACISCGNQYINSTRSGCVSACPPGEFSNGHQCRNSDCYIVISFWGILNGSLSVYSNFSCCGYNGVSCDPTRTYVTHILWQNKGLSGFIASSISQLKHLEIMYFSFDNS
jgi:hypothetical protein